MRTICDCPAQQQSRESFHIFQDLKSEFSLDKSIFKDLKFAHCWCLQRHWENLITFVDIVCEALRVAWRMEIEIFPRLCLTPATKCWTQGAAQNEMYKKCVSWSWALCCVDFLYCFFVGFPASLWTASSMCEPANTHTKKRKIVKHLCLVTI